MEATAGTRTRGGAARRLALAAARRAEALAHARVRARAPPRARRREALITGPLLIITGVAALLGVAVVSLLFQKELSATFLFLFTSMPRFEAAVTADGGVGAGNALYGMYLNFRTISFFVMSVAIIVAGLSYGLESVNVVPPRIASGILGNGMLYLVVIMVFPHFWDIVADAVEWSSLWILSPGDPSRAHETVTALLDYMSPGRYPEVDYARLFGGAGSAIAEAAFSSIVDFVTMREGDGALQAIGEGYERTVTAFLTEVLLFFLKAIALLTMALTAFLLGTVRYVLTGLLAVAVPLVLALSLLPQFSRVTALMRDSLVALTIVPLFSALAVAAGVAVLDDLESSDFGVSEVVIGPGDVGRNGCGEGEEGCADPGALVPPPAVQELTHGVRKFFMALAVLALAIYFPAMLAPMISRIMSSVQQHISTTGLAGTVLLSGVRGAAAIAPAALTRGYSAARTAGMRFSDGALHRNALPPRSLFSRRAAVPQVHVEGPGAEAGADGTPPAPGPGEAPALYPAGEATAPEAIPMTSTPKIMRIIRDRRLIKPREVKKPLVPRRPAKSGTFLRPGRGKRKPKRVDEMRKPEGVRKVEAMAASLAKIKAERAAKERRGKRPRGRSKDPGQTMLD